MLKQLDPSDLVLTVNQRLAADLRQRYDQYQLARGLGAWQTASILPLNTWLLKNYGVLTHLPDHHAICLWQHIIQSSDVGQLLICDHQAASDAYAAWQLCVHWGITDEQLNKYDHDGLSAFREWRDQYILHMAQHNIADQTHAVLCALHENLSVDSRKIYLAGIDNISLSINAIFDKLKLDHEVMEWESRSTLAEVTLRCAPEQESELRSMVDWAYRNQHRQIACIVPDINNCHQMVRELFQARSLSANIVAAIPLANYPIVDAARLCLQGALCTLDFNERSSLQRSPFIRSMPQFQHNTQHSPRTFAKRFAQILKDCGWPGARQLSSEEHQTLQRFTEALGEYAKLELIFDTFSPEVALSQWRSLTRSIAFQPQTSPTNIQVLGLLEATGLQFDAIWLSGMTDDVLPKPLNPNPYLPVELQRSLNLPRANPLHELLFARQLIDRLARSCTELIVSYAQMEGDRVLQVSPLFERYTATPLPIIQRAVTDLKKLSTMVDQQAPPVSMSEQLRGGTYILKLQSACPLRAFAEVRLKANPIEEITTGIDPSVRGTWVHEVLQSIWSELKTQDALIEANLESLINRHLDLTSRHFPDHACYEIERQRLQKILTRWFEYERHRPSFTIHALEAEQEFSIAGLTLKMRLDRIDKLQDGSLTVIDYKTGKDAIVASWFGERPHDPQLPLYCVASESITHVAFGKVRVSKLGFCGLSTQVNLLPDTEDVSNYASAWDALCDEWRIHLTKLAHDFMSGVALVDPRDGALTCEFCHCYSLCRIFENGSH